MFEKKKKKTEQVSPHEATNATQGCKNREGKALRRHTRRRRTRLQAARSRQTSDTDTSGVAVWAISPPLKNNSNSFLDHHLHIAHVRGLFWSSHAPPSSSHKRLSCAVHLYKCLLRWHSRAHAWIMRFSTEMATHLTTQQR